MSICKYNNCASEELDLTINSKTNFGTIERFRSIFSGDASVSNI